MEARGRIQTLNVASGNQFHIRLTCDWAAHSRSEMRSTVFPFWMVGRVMDVHFHALAVIYIGAECEFHSLNVQVHRITGNLHPIPHPAGNVLVKLGGGSVGALSDLK